VKSRTEVSIVVSRHAATAWHAACTYRSRALVVVDQDFPLEEDPMTWTKPEFEVVELGMEVGAYAGNA
jgi:coenzyme PQQ precursor peptide PqqA